MLDFGLAMRVQKLSELECVAPRVRLDREFQTPCRQLGQEQGESRCSQTRNEISGIIQ